MHAGHFVCFSFSLFHDLLQLKKTVGILKCLERFSESFFKMKGYVITK